MFTRRFNTAFFRSFVFLAFALCSFQASAVSHRCPNLFETSVPAEVLIERTAAVEKMVHDWVTTPIATIDPEKVAALAIRVESVVDRLLAQDLDWKAGVQLVEGIEAEAVTIKMQRVSDFLDVSASSFGLPRPSKVTNRASREVEMSRLGDKDLADLPPHLREKYDEFILVLLGLENSLVMDAKWDLEKLKPSGRIKIQGAVYSVRLNHGYRILFTVGLDHSLTIQRISKDVTH